MKRIITAFALLLALAGSAFAGQVNPPFAPTGDLNGTPSNTKVGGMNGCGLCIISGGTGTGNIGDLRVWGPDALRLTAQPFTSTSDFGIIEQTANCGSNQMQTTTAGTLLLVAAPHGCTQAAFTGTISGATLTLNSGINPNVSQGQLLNYSGCNACAYITGGANITWTLNTSPGNVGPLAMTSAAIARQPLVIRPPNSNEQYFQFNVIDGSPLDFESGILVSDSQASIKPPAAASLTMSQNAASGSNILAFTSVAGVSVGQVVFGFNIPITSQVQSIVSTARATLIANGVSASGQKVLATTNTTGVAVGQQCTDNTTPAAIGASNTIASIQAGVSITLASNLSASTVNGDSIVCDPTVTMTQANTAPLTPGGIAFYANATTVSTASALYDGGDASIAGNLNVGGPSTSLGFIDSRAASPVINPLNYVSPTNHAPQGTDCTSAHYSPGSTWLNTDTILWVLEQTNSTQGCVWQPHGPLYMGEKGGINLHTATDVAIGMTTPPTWAPETVRSFLDHIYVHSAFGAGAATVAQVSFWTGPNQTGTMIAPPQTLAGLTATNLSVEMQLAKTWAFTSATGSNTGNGTIGSIATGTTGGLKTYPGVYTITLTGPTAFNVVDANGNTMPNGTVGSAYSNPQINFTVSAGGTPFAPGDTFTVTAVAGGQVSIDGGNGDGPLYIHINTQEPSSTPNFGVTVLGHINY